MYKFLAEKGIPGINKLMPYQLKGISSNLWVIMFLMVFVSCSEDNEEPIPNTPNPEVEEQPSLLDSLTIETFTFPSNGEDIKGKIYLPDTYMTNNNLPAIFLIDFKEQHFAVATDEFEQVIRGVLKIENFEALVVTLDEIPNIDAQPGTFANHKDVFENMTKYVNDKYTNNTSRTFIGRGSEGGVILLTLLNEDPNANIFDNYIVTDSPTSFNTIAIGMNQNNSVQENMVNKKLHFSYSASNNQTVCQTLISSFEEAQYPWLEFKSKAYLNSDYENNYPTSYSDGLEFVYKQ